MFSTIRIIIIESFVRTLSNREKMIYLKKVILFLIQLYQDGIIIDEIINISIDIVKKLYWVIK